MINLIKKLWNESRPEIIGGLVVAFILGIVSFIKSIKIWKHIFCFLKNVYQFLFSFLTLPFWSLIIIGIVPLLLYIVLHDHKKIKRYFFKAIFPKKRAKETNTDEDVNKNTIIQSIDNVEKVDKELVKKITIDSLEWIKSLIPSNFKKYILLFWFPANNTLVFKLHIRTEKSCIDTPVFRDLIDHNVLKLIDSDDTNYKYELNREVYNLLDELFEKLVSEFGNSPKSRYKQYRFSTLLQETEPSSILLLVDTYNYFISLVNHNS